MKVNVPELEARVKEGLVKKFKMGDYTGWCYTQKCQFEKKWDEHTIIARGVVTLEDGTVISKPFSKFFNLGEPESGEIPWTDTIEVTEKIDGSLIVVSFYKGEMIVNSKGSFTSDHAAFARKWISENMKEWATSCAHFSKHDLSSWTYCFEAVFPDKSDDTKVISYGDRADLTLLAAIETRTGEDLTYKEVCDLAETMGCNPVRRYDFDNIDDIIASCKARKIEEGEGLVLHFVESGKRVKVKSDEYVRLHRLLSHTTYKQIIKSLMNGDDIEAIYSRLPDELFQEVKIKIANIKADYDAIWAYSNAYAYKLAKEYATPKEQALFIESHPSLAEYKSVIFAILRGKDEKKVIWNIIKNKYKEVEKEE